ncbi:MAG: TetR/AcrR family transcriptional regulator [Acidimicrobiales bacterium]
MGLDRVKVIEAAAALVDEQGPEGFTLARLAARLGIRSQSIYAHVDGLESLRRELALVALDDLSLRLGRAAMGRSGRGALHALADTHAAFAAERPGLYACSLRSPDGDEELAHRVDDVSDPWHAVLASFGLRPIEIVHYHRALWAAIHGFVTLRHQGLMTREASPDRSFTLMIDLFADALEDQRKSSRDRALS